MAKKQIESINEEERDDKKPGFFQKFFMLFIIPLLFTVTIVLIVAYFTNTNVFQFADSMKEKIPFLDTKKEEVIENTSITEQKIVTLQAELQEKEAQIDKLQSEIKASSEKNNELLTEQERLNFEIEKLKREQEDVKKDFQEILSAYEKMPAKVAAPILIEMKDAELALRIMSNLKPDTLSAIFAKMPPADAARFTELLAQQ
ncbi:MotE family protein [Bacillus ndiopicus]|uniref:MotE family protein n=1 Tax=Bacillus ndiopicus TaxID=1347368 RepID=UPI0005AB5633|nr:hypothetical protein [Bacillus ndiopicus]